jgi:hypothetical protein
MAMVPNVMFLVMEKEKSGVPYNRIKLAAATGQNLGASRLRECFIELYSKQELTQQG